MQKLKNLVFYGIGALFLMADAFYNSYPILYSDVTTYIANGFDLQTPFDRPITYCLFLRLFSLNGLSLWTVIFAQSFLVSGLIFRVAKILFGDGLNKFVVLAVLLFLSLFTSLSWTASQPISDIFTPILLLTTIILFLGKPNKKEAWLLFFVFLLATAMHLSHISYNLVFLTVVVLVRSIRFFRLREVIRLRTILILFGLTLIALSTMLSALAKSRHVFFMGAMNEHGILKTFLDDNCETTNYQLCAYKDSLPKRAFEFVWDADGPVNKMGGWKATEEEFNAIIFQTLTIPKYIGMHVQASLAATYEQLLKFKINDGNTPFPDGSLVYERMRTYFPGELEQFKQSKQNRDALSFTKNLNYFYSIIVLISIAGIVFWLFVLKMGQRRKYILLTVLVILGIVVNAWGSATFSNAIDRFGAKMIWLLPLLAVYGLWLYWLSKKEQVALSHLFDLSVARPPERSA
ncbi:MAG: hypothetical protein L3J66_05610 [Bacteroidales bacterium]|nr:hypothetical protein [Bacteroidales bacterium]